MFMRSERLFLRPAWPEEQSERPGFDQTVQVHDPRHPLFLITLPDHDGAPVVGIVGFAAWHGETELVLWIAPEWRGQGFATEAAQAALGVARMLGHCRILASCFAASPQGGRVLAKLRFAPTGQVRQRHSAARGWTPAALVCACNLCPPASDPAPLQRAA